MVVIVSMALSIVYIMVVSLLPIMSVSSFFTSAFIRMIDANLLPLTDKCIDCMCLRPLRIRNKGFRPLDPRSLRYYTVPCGHCDQCISSRVAEMQFRCDNEYISVRNACNVDKLDADVFFLTTTYKPECRPSVTYEATDGRLKTLSCWNQKHVTNFLKSLRNNGVEFKYVLSCERGHGDTYTDDRGRLRTGQRCPHYHFIFFVYNGASYFADLVRQYWTHGRIYNERVSRTQEKAIEYVTKYTFKDSLEKVNFIKPSQIVSLSNVSSSKDIAPRTRQSNGIGLDWIDVLAARSSDVLCRFLANGRVKTLTGVETSIPRYYWKRLTSTTQVCGRCLGLHHVEMYDDVLGYRDCIETYDLIKTNSYKTLIGEKVYDLRLADKCTRLIADVGSALHSGQIKPKSIITDMIGNFYKSAFDYVSLHLDMFREYFDNLVTNDEVMRELVMYHDRPNYCEDKFALLYGYIMYVKSYISAEKVHANKIRYQQNFAREIEKNPMLLVKTEF